MTACVASMCAVRVPVHAYEFRATDLSGQPKLLPPRNPSFGYSLFSFRAPGTQYAYYGAPSDHSTRVLAAVSILDRFTPHAAGGHRGRWRRQRGGSGNAVSCPVG